MYKSHCNNATLLYSKILFIKNNLTIFFIFILAALNTIAFGGVATGNMKAYEQLTATGNIRDNGLIRKCMACNKYLRITGHDLD